MFIPTLILNAFLSPANAELIPIFTPNKQPPQRVYEARGWNNTCIGEERFCEILLTNLESNNQSGWFVTGAYIAPSTRGDLTIDLSPHLRVQTLKGRCHGGMVYSFKVSDLQKPQDISLSDIPALVSYCIDDQNTQSTEETCHYLKETREGPSKDVRAFMAVEAPASYLYEDTTRGNACMGEESFCTALLNELDKQRQIGWYVTGGYITAAFSDGMPKALAPNLRIQVMGYNCLQPMFYQFKGGSIDQTPRNMSFEDLPELVRQCSAVSANPIR